MSQTPDIIEERLDYLTRRADSAQDKLEDHARRLYALENPTMVVMPGPGPIRITALECPESRGVILRPLESTRWGLTGGGTRTQI